MLTVHSYMKIVASWLSALSFACRLNSSTNKIIQAASQHEIKYFLTFSIIGSELLELLMRQTPMKSQN